MFEATFTDSSGAVLLGKWFHAGYLAGVIQPGQKIALYGKVELDSYASGLAMLHPEFEILSGEEDEGESSLHVGRVVPIYEAAGKITTRVFRKLLHNVLQTLPPIRRPASGIVRARLGLLDRWTRDPARSLPAAGGRSPAAQRIPLAVAVPHDLRGVLLAGVRAGAQARARRASRRASPSSFPTGRASRSSACSPSSPPGRRSACSARSPATWPSRTP